MTLDEAENIIEAELENRKTSGYYTHDRKIDLIKARRVLAKYINEKMEKLDEQEEKRRSENSKANCSSNDKAQIEERLR